MDLNTSKKVLILDKDGFVKNTNCLICGYDNEIELTSGDICLCCSNQFMTQIRNPKIKRIVNCRKSWIEEGIPLEIEGDPEAPNPWNIDVMWKQVTENVPEEFWKEDPLYLEYIENKQS